MMTFGQYAQYYDLIYKDKDYTQECKFLEAIFKKYLKAAPRTILDLGCGTGNHMRPLLKRGYTLTGLDASPGMLKMAQKKMAQGGWDVALKHGRLESFKFNKQFDVIICMFSVIDYVWPTKKVLKTFQNVYKHLKLGGLFIFDFWHAPAVNDYYSPTRRRIFEKGGVTIKRDSTNKIFPQKKMCRVSYTCTVKDNGVKTFKEDHWLRYFEQQEIKDLLKQSGLSVKMMCPFMHLKGTIKRNTWDVTVVAQKV